MQIVGKLVRSRRSHPAQRPSIAPLRAVVIALALLAVSACSKPEPAEVVISLDEATQPLNSATVTVDYSQASAKPLMKGGSPACAVLPPDMTAGFEDDGSGTLTINVKARRGFTAPIDLAVCRMLPDTKDTAVATISARLRVSVAAATDSKGEQLDDRRLAMTRSGGRDVSSAPAGAGSSAEPGTAAGSTAGSPAGAPAVRTPGSPESGAPTGAASLGEALRQRSTGNATKEAQREIDRAEREARNQLRNDSGDIDGGSDVAGADGEDLGDPNEENDPEVTPTTPAYDVTAEVTNDAGLIGALQFDLNHKGGSGGWQGAKAGVACRWLVGGGITACNDTGAGRVRCALADISGFQTPSPIVTCTFKSSEDVSAASFSVQVVDASSPDFDKTSVSMAVTSVVRR